MSEQAVTRPVRDRSLLDSVKKSAWVIGSALLVFVAARNSITWHAQNVWGASGDFWQSQWGKIHGLFGGDTFLLGFVGTASITVVAYWLFNAFFLVLDVFGPPKILLRYKVQEDQNVPVDPYKLRRAIKQILINQVFASPLVLYVVYRLMLLRGTSFSTELPSFQWVVWEIFLMTWIEEFGFYYSHRLMHHPRLYKHIHKRHHEWTASISIVSIYAHPIEHIVSNMMPPVLGFLLVGSHIATAWMWFVIVLGSTTIAHCGYHFPFLPSPEQHDFHHLKFNYNFGVLGVLDRLHGTDEAFRSSKQYERHYMLLNTVPVKDVIPDPVKKASSSEQFENVVD